MGTRPNSTAVCRECQSVIAANAVAGHIKWHIMLVKAIMSASGLMTQEEIEAQMEKHQLALEGKIAVVW